MATCLCLGFMCTGVLRQWPLPQLAPLLLYLGLARVHGAFALDVGTFARGRAAPGFVVAFAIASTAALFAWRHFAQPDLTTALASIPPLPTSLLPIAGIGFALTNAALEEAFFRGIVYERWRAACGGGPWPHVAQAALFGLAHLHGVPSGWVGALLAGAWGLGLSLLRERSRGLLAPWLAHVAADIGVFAVLTVGVVTPT